MKQIIFLFLFILIYSSCSNSVKTAQENTTVADSAIIGIRNETVAADSMPERRKAMAEDTIKALRTLYIINFEGEDTFNDTTVVAEEAKENEVWHKDFGTQFEVIKEYKNWYRGRIIDGRYIDLFYIRKEGTGDALHIPLDGNYLNEGAFPYTEDDQADDESDESAEAMQPIILTVISKKKYDALKKSSTSWFVQDSLFKRTADGVLKIKTKNKYIIYQDSGESSYDYLGQYPTLNAYLILYSCGECEEAFYQLVDKNTGQKIKEFADVPYLSPNKKQFVCIPFMWGSERDYTAIRLYNAGSKNNDLLVSKDFFNWSTITDEPGFWGADNCFYMPVLPAIANWQQNPTHDTPKGYNYRYIKIQFKVPVEKSLHK